MCWAKYAPAPSAPPMLATRMSKPSRVISDRTAAVTTRVIWHSGCQTLRQDLSSACNSCGDADGVTEVILPSACHPCTLQPSATEHPRTGRKCAYHMTFNNTTIWARIVQHGRSEKTSPFLLTLVCTWAGAVEQQALLAALFAGELHHLVAADHVLGPQPQVLHPVDLQHPLTGHLWSNDSKLSPCIEVAVFLGTVLRCGLASTQYTQTRCLQS